MACLERVNFFRGIENLDSTKIEDNDRLVLHDSQGVRHEVTGEQLMQITGLRIFVRLAAASRLLVQLGLVSQSSNIATRNYYDEFLNWRRRENFHGEGPPITFFNRTLDLDASLNGMTTSEARQLHRLA